MFHIIKRFMPTGLQELVRPAYHRCLLRRNKKLVEKFGEQEMIRRCYFAAFGRNPDFENPQTFNEKIAWLKLHIQTPLITQCADKIRVRDYVKEKIGSQYLIPIVGIYQFPDEINFDALPEKCVIKANHGSQCNIFYNKDSKSNRKKIIRRLKYWLSLNYYYFGFEWGYKNIQPGIIIEERLKTDSGQVPNDIKIFCINGEPVIINYVEGRYGPNTQKSIYNAKWELLPITYMGNKHVSVPHPKLENFEIILDLARKLAAPFAFARTDFYLVQNKIYFSEITFYPEGGHCQFSPSDTDDKLGKLLHLPQK